MTAGPVEDGNAQADDLSSRLAAVRARIAEAGADPGGVRVVAVTKGFGVDAIEAACGAGLADIGESYAQDLQAKARTAPPGVRWHFLGAPQRNKIAALAPLVALWQGVDRVEVLEALAVRRPGAGVLVEVNVAAEPGKHGCSPAEAPALVGRGTDLGLDVQGLMTVAPQQRSDAARCFADLAAMGGRLGVKELSMGMSGDFDLAVAEGATMVRLGRILFGPRPGPTTARR